MARFTQVFPESEVCREIILIFLTVGNWHKGFDRLVEAVDNLKAQAVIDDEVIAQIGSGRYGPTHLEVIKYCSPARFAEIITKAQVIITHAGVGTICQAVIQGKPVIVVPRRSSLGEISNDHQFTTAKRFENEGRILVAYEVSELPAKLEQAKTFVPAVSHTDNRIAGTIQAFLEELAIRKYGRQANA